MPTQEELREYFDYKDGQLIRRMKTGRKGFIGQIVGHKDATRILVKHKRVSYQAHRLIWVWHNGSIDPKLVIDHIDHNPFNNSIANLRLVSQGENVHNQRRSKYNTSGVPNVYASNGKYCVHFRYNRVAKNYGCYKTIEEASKRREEVRELLGFHENHGKVIH